MIAIRSWRDVTIIDHSNYPMSTALTKTREFEFQEDHWTNVGAVRGQNLPFPIDKAHHLYNSMLLPHKPSSGLLLRYIGHAASGISGLIQANSITAYFVIILTLKCWSFIRTLMPTQRNPPRSKWHQYSRSLDSIQRWTIIKVCNGCFYLFLSNCCLKHTWNEYFQSEMLSHIRIHSWMQSVFIHECNTL